MFFLHNVSKFSILKMPCFLLCKPEAGVVELNVAVVSVAGEGSPHEVVKLLLAANIHV